MIRRSTVYLEVALLVVIGAWLGQISATAQGANIAHTLEGTFDGADAPGGPFQSVLGVAVDNSGGGSDGDIYVGEVAEAGEPLASTVRKFNKDGNYAGVEIDGTNTPNGSFSFLAPGTFSLSFDGLAVDGSGTSKGDLYVTDLEHGVVDRFNESGEYLCQITGRPVPSASECAGPVGSATPDGNLAPIALAISDTTGKLYVADSEHGVVNEFDDSGQYAGQIADPHITQPTAIDLDSTDALYMVNDLFFNGANVVKFNSIGFFTSLEDSDEPIGITVDRDTNHLYVSHGADGGITELDQNGTLASRFGSGMGLSYPSLAIADSSGRVYAGNFNVVPSVDIYSADIFLLDATSGEATQVEETTATLNGSVDPDGSDEVTLCQFEYGHTDSYGQTISCSPAIPYSIPTEVGAKLSGLSPSSTYHFRIRVENSVGTEDLSEDTVFYTQGPPTIEEQSAGKIERSTAELRAKINPHGLDSEFRFEYVDAEHFSQEGGFASPAVRSTPTSELGNGLTPLSVGQGVSGLSVGTTYHYRAVASNSRGTITGPDQTFATTPVARIVSQWVYAHFDSATVEAKINPLGLDTTCQLQFVSTTEFQRSGYANANLLPCNEGLGSGSVDQIRRTELSGLKSDSKYHFRFLVTNQSGTIIGEDQSFSTFGIKAFSIEDVDEEGNPVTQAGAHPFATVSHYEFTHTIVTSQSGTRGSLNAFIKEILTEQPPGRIGYTDGAPRCDGYVVDEERCGSESQVGTVEVEFFQGNGRSTSTRAQYNVFAPRGIASRYASTNPYTFSDGKIRTGGDYGTTGGASNLTEEARIVAVTSTIWGVPADPAHRGGICPLVGMGCAAEMPLLRIPTSCAGPQTARSRVATWQAPREFVHASAEMPAITGCDKIKFDPSIEWRPTTEVADSPSGLHINIHVPQDEDPKHLAVADLKDVVITSAKGLVFNPAAANGLVACSPTLFNLNGEGPAHCPDAAKVGTVEINTPQLDHHVLGGIYMATPYDNPFDSLFAIFIAIEDPETGVIVKLAGEIKLDPKDGQLTAVFSKNPQLPIEDFKLDFFGGPGAVLRTPLHCGTYLTQSVLTPWSAPASGPPPAPSDTYRISTGPNGTDCVSSESEAPHNPSFQAGTTDSVAGSYAPFVMRLHREDGSQQIAGLKVSPPPGLMGRLTTLSYCPQDAIEAAKVRAGIAEKTEPSCPADSEVGSVTIGAGAGSNPFEAYGNIYLAGPYKGAPLSLVVVVPAVAGPYDLGTVVIRTAIQVDMETGQLRVESDPVPRILQGVPLDVRSISVKLDRPRFTLNPTNCDPLSVRGQVTSVFGRVASIDNPFQVGGCGRLAFAPHLRLRLLGDVHHGAHPSLRAMLRMPRAGANISRAAVRLPSSIFLDNGHIRGICTRTQFAEGTCPANSIYAYAMVWSPLLDRPLKGPVYMRTSVHPLPDLFIDLRGQIRLAFGGEVGSALGGIGASIENLPDVPVSRFVLTMRGGSKGLLQSSINACAEPQRAFAEFEGQNGKIEVFHPLLRARCPLRQRRFRDGLRSGR